jgi:ABC-type multidrug transport system fused ATPase/permease subunit
MSHAAFTKPDNTPAARSEDVPARSEVEPSIGQLVAQASRDVSSLVKSEIALAKSEVKISVKAGGIGAALFAVAGFIGLLAVVMLSFGIVYLIHLTGLDLAWCFLIVFLLYLLLAAVVAFVGFRSVKKVRPPQRAIHQAQETKETLLHRGH